VFRNEGMVLASCESAKRSRHVCEMEADVQGLRIRETRLNFAALGGIVGYNGKSRTEVMLSSDPQFYDGKRTWISSDVAYINVEAALHLKQELL
jgi:hypothetical protein